jgi:hypothetical protein
MDQVYIYSTASTVAAFLNGYHIEQAYGFNYKENVPKIPIYGYNDYEYSKVVRGKGVVQGILVLNFVFPGYLTAVLTYRNDTFDPKLYNYNLPGGPGDYLPSTQKQLQDNIISNLNVHLTMYAPVASSIACVNELIINPKHKLFLIDSVTLIFPSLLLLIMPIHCSLINIIISYSINYKIITML